MTTRRWILAIVVVAAAAGRPAGAQIVEADRTPARNSAYFEFGGPGGLYSLNYEYTARQSIGLRAGGTWWDFTNMDQRRERVSAAILGVTLRIDISELVDRCTLGCPTEGIGEGGRFIELGAAMVAGTHYVASYGTEQASGAFKTFSPSLGLRYQPARDRWMYRVTFTPLVPIMGGAATFPDKAAMAAGLSVGLSFE